MSLRVKPIGPSVFSDLVDSCVTDKRNCAGHVFYKTGDLKDFRLSLYQKLTIV